VGSGIEKKLVVHSSKSEISNVAFEKIYRCRALRNRLWPDWIDDIQSINNS